jgi:exopolysaccharide biosynthesis protein
LKSAGNVLRRSLIVIAFLLATVACTAAEWEKVHPGVEYKRIRRNSIDVYITKIDLRSRAIRVIATTEDERGLTVSEFADKTDAIVAINADYFDEQSRPLGLSMGACGVWTKGQPLQRKQGLVAVGRRRAEIQARTMETKRWMTGAVSGWPMLVSGCAVLQDLPGSDHFTRAPHPRTAVALSKDGKTMYFVAADGRKEGVPGMTLPELAAFLHEELGACAAMNLDGGGSTAMWVDDEIVNRPSDGPERKVGNHLAVVAARDYRGCDTRETKKKD